VQIYPEIISDIRCEVLFERKNNTTYCIGNAQIDNYIFVNEQQKKAILTSLKYMDGTNSLEDIQKILLSHHYLKIDTYKIYNLCKKNGFIKSENLNEGFVKPKTGFNELDIFMVNVFSIGIGKLDRIIIFLSERLRFIVFAMLVITVISIGMLLGNRDNQITEVNWINMLSNINAIYFYIILSTISILLHEFSHVIVSYRYGIKPQTLTFALYAYVTPMIYVRLKGVYFIESMKRISIWISGSAMNFFLALICFVAINYSDGYLCLFFMTGVTVNLVLGISSLIPLVTSDGYYILSTLLKTPNLRKVLFLML